MKIVVLGKEGMLGRYVYQYLKSNFNNVYGTTRNDLNFLDIDNLANNFKKSYQLDKNDIVINCVGIIKHIFHTMGPIDVIKINSIAPLIFSEMSKEIGFKFINITSDCVYSGKIGDYTEKEEIDTKELYALSKSMGESDFSINIRTSFIGEEIKHKRSLLEWSISNEGKEVNGFVNYIWNGVTCLQLAKIIEQMIKENIWWNGTRHIFSPDKFSKYELVEKFCHLYDVYPKKIIKYTLANKIDRTLNTVYKENSLFNIPNFFIQLEEMKNFHETLYEGA